MLFPGTCFLSFFLLYLFFFSTVYRYKPDNRHTWASIARPSPRLMRSLLRHSTQVTTLATIRQTVSITENDVDRDRMDCRRGRKHHQNVKDIGADDIAQSQPILPFSGCDNGGNKLRQREVPSATTVRPTRVWERPKERAISFCAVYNHVSAADNGCQAADNINHADKRRQHSDLLILLDPVCPCITNRQHKKAGKQQ